MYTAHESATIGQRKEVPNDDVLPGTPHASSTPNRPRRQMYISNSSVKEEDEYDFVNPPKDIDDYYCPVTFNLLRQPHLTLCCGAHLSKEAAMRIKLNEQACPLCKKKDWDSVLNKNFRRKVNELRVYCRHKDKGCAWEGEICDFDRHIESCPMKDHAPLDLSEYRQKEYAKGKSKSLPTNEFCHTQRVEESDSLCCGSPTKPTKLGIKCQQKKKPPCWMIRGSCVSEGEDAYFAPAPNNAVYKYHFKCDRWEQLPPSPCTYSSLVLIENRLTCIGGRINGVCTNKLYTLNGEEWCEEYPSMFMARSCSAVVTTPIRKHVVVIGGNDTNYVMNKSHWCTAVEMLHLPDKTWFRIPGLPRPLQRPCATVCRGKIYVIGADKGYSYSVKDLSHCHNLDDTRSCDLSHFARSSNTTTSWTQLPRLPVKFPTAATLKEQMVLVGGSSSGASVSSIYQLMEEKWEEVGLQASNKRYWCLVTTNHETNDRMVIVGVRTEGDNIVEECIAE